MNKRGFTLVELIATIVILGVIMTIAIPNVLSIIEKNKQDDFIETAKLLISEAEYKVRGDTSIELPKVDSHSIIITLNYLNSNNFNESPYEYPYDLSSFVLITKEGSNYNYYVHLSATKINPADTGQDYTIIDTKNRGINLASIEDLDSDNRFNLVKKGDEVEIDMLTKATNNKKITYINKDFTIDKVY